MNVEVKTLFEYANNGIQCIYNGDKELLEKIALNTQKTEPFEQPDIIIPLGDKVFAIEHFEFDASSFNKKGSMDKRKLAERNREFDKLIADSDFSEVPLVATTSVDCTYSSDCYIKNFKTVFENHIAKITEYKKHIIDANKAKQMDDIIMCFFIVDTTPLGCYCLEDSLKIFVPFQVKECLELITQAKEIDCLLFGFFDGNNNSLLFISNSPDWAVD